MSKRKRTAPPGCFWKGNTLYGRVRLKGASARKFSLQTDDPEVARERYKNGKKRIVAALRFGDASYTFDDAHEAWAEHIKDAVSSKTVKRYMVSLDQIVPDFLEGRPLDDINTKLLAEIVTARKKAGVSNATIKRDLNAVSSVLNVAVGADMLAANPVLAFLAKNKKTALLRERREPMLLPREADIALVKSRAPRMVAHLVEAALLTGARENELIRAQAHQLDNKLKQITLIGKRNKQRTIDGTVFGAYDYLAALPRFLKSPRLFWHHEGEGYSNFASHFHRLVKQTAKWAAKHKIDFQPFRFHDLRHLHAIEFLKSRAGTIHDLQFRLGHTSVMTTEMYLRSGLLTGEEIRAAMYGIAKPALQVIGGTA